MSDTDEDVGDITDFLHSSRSKRQTRGVKDFVPDGSLAQAQALQRSRDALFHLIREERRQNSKTTSEGILDRSTGLTRVIKSKGNHFRVMGHNVSGTLLLYPEEAAWLCSIGALILKDQHGNECSLEDIYCILFSKHDGWIDYEKYQVYAFLRRLGFIVQRSRATTLRDMPKSSQSLMERVALYLFRKVREMWTCFQNGIMSTISRCIGTFPLVCNARYTTFEQVYSTLRIIPSTARYNPFESRVTCDWDVYKPNPRWKKSDPGSPDYKIFVTSAKDAFFTMEKLSRLFEDSPESTRTSSYIPIPYIMSRKPTTSFFAAVVDDAEGVSFLQLTKSSVVDLIFGSDEKYRSRNL